MQTIAEYNVKLPDYCLSYLINGDNSGLDPKDIKIIDSYMSEFYQIAEKTNSHVNICLDDNEEPFFTWSPSFGLACNCYNAKIILLK